MSECAYSLHFDTTDGKLSPQPWMQWRNVGGVTVASKSGNYPVAGGGNKNDLLQAIQQSWTNDSPVDQWCYGVVSRGGCIVTLQARSRGGLVVLSACDKGDDPGELTDASVVGVGADTGRGGMLSVGASYCIAEVRQNSVSFPVAPEKTGWWRLAPGEKLTAAVQVWFTSEFWENGTIDGGSGSSESSYVTGETRLDLFAVPIIE